MLPCSWLEWNVVVQVVVRPRTGRTVTVAPGKAAISSLIACRSCITLVGKLDRPGQHGPAVAFGPESNFQLVARSRTFGNDHGPLPVRRTGNLVDEVGAFATDDDLFLYSPDGLIDGDGLLEVKTLFSPERIMTIVGNGDVSDFIDQCMFGLWLTGRQWIDLVVWVPSLERLTIKRIDRDEDYIEAMETDLMAFSRLVTQYENTLRAAIQSTNEPALEAA